MGPVFESYGGRVLKAASRPVPMCLLMVTCWRCYGVVGTHTGGGRQPTDADVLHGTATTGAPRSGGRQLFRHRLCAVAGRDVRDGAQPVRCAAHPRGEICGGQDRPVGGAGAAGGRPMQRRHRLAGGLGRQSPEPCVCAARGTPPPPLGLPISQLSSMS